MTFASLPESFALSLSGLSFPFQLSTFLSTFLASMVEGFLWCSRTTFLAAPAWIRCACGSLLSLSRIMSRRIPGSTVIPLLLPSPVCSSDQFWEVPLLLQVVDGPRWSGLVALGKLA